LVTLLINLQLARTALGPETQEVAERLDAAIADAKTAVDELRQLAAGIHPAILTTRGLVPAITALAKRSPIPVVVTADVAKRVDPSLESNAYFVVAEAITNALKHARASRIDVLVELTDTLRVTIVDNGIGGIQSTAPGEGGLGLSGLADRVAAFDGALVIESPPGVGTRVSAEFSIAG
jgi:signal transduction histidine kinase